MLQADGAYAEQLFGIDRGGNKPRKDLARWSDAPAYAAYFYDESFDGQYEWPENLNAQAIQKVLRTYIPLYDPSLDRQQWFDALKEMAPSLGFCPEVKEYKKDPSAWIGHVGDISTVLRVAVTGRRNTPDLHSILQLQATTASGAAISSIVLLLLMASITQMPKWLLKSTVRLT